MTEKMPSSVMFGSRPRMFLMSCVFVGSDAVFGDDFRCDGDVCFHER